MWLCGMLIGKCRAFTNGMLEWIRKLMTSTQTGIKKERFILVTIVILGLLLSGIKPYDRITWLMEVFPVLIGLPLLVLTYRHFPLTPLAYRLLTIHALILMLGGHYTYARVPLGYWVQDLFGFTRNHYDRLGHFAQGFIPAILAREVLLRCSPLYPGKMLFFLVACVCLAISASYEFIEWWAAIAGGEAAAAFLGTQGDVWDTQWDMFLALIGSLAAQLTLARLHDRQLDRIKE
jgi:putative membrane protein